MPTPGLRSGSGSSPPVAGVAATDFVGSPAVPAALLLHGMLFGFAAASYIGAPWRRGYTVAFYVVVLLWAGFAIARRLRQRSVALNGLDLLFGAFLAIVLGSVAINWWPGTIQYLLFTPMFFVLPFALGRVMTDDDVLKFWSMLLAMGGLLLALMPIEYVKDSLPYINWPSPFLFAQGHGVMLSGLLFAATFLVLVSRLLLAGIEKADRSAGSDGRIRLQLFLLLGLVILAVGWISARGSAIAAVLGMAVLLTFSARRDFRRKLEILLVFAIFVALAFFNPFQNKFSKQFYQAVLQPPPIFVSAGSFFGSSDGRSAGNGALDHGDPILGREACAAVKDSISDRWVHYQTALAIFLTKPLAGVGANRYGHYSCSGPGWFPHSTVLQVLAELGLVGMAAYGLMMLLAFRAIFRRYRSSGELVTRAICGWLLAYLTLQLLTSQLYGNYFLSAGLYLAVGIASRAVDDARRVDGG